MLKGKIHRATVVQAELDYVGSITVDEDLMDAAGIREYEQVQIGDRLKGYVSRITEDNRVDVALQQQGYDEVKKSAARLVELLQGQGGTLPLWDASAPDEVARLTGMSKKVFKRSAGLLMKQGRITMQEGRISLVDEE